MGCLVIGSAKHILGLFSASARCIPYFYLYTLKIAISSFFHNFPLLSSPLSSPLSSLLSFLLYSLLPMTAQETNRDLTLYRPKG
jgi:hypothetical protein